MHHFPGTRRSFSAAARLVAAGVVLLASAAQAGAPVATVPVERPQVIRTVSESGGDVINAVEVVRYPAGAALRPAASVRVAAAQARPASRGKTRRRFPEEDPAVVQCVNLAAGNYRIDPTPMHLILDVERGTLGRTTQNSNGTFSGRITEILSSDKGPNPICDKCKDDRKNKPVKGMEIIRGMKKEGAGYAGGTILRPADGKVFKSKMALADGGKKLNVSGCVAFICKEQVWVRQ